MKIQSAIRFAAVPALSFLIVAAAVVGAAAAPVHRRALLIGVSNYSEFNKEGPFGNLACTQDLRYIQSALVHTFKFDPADKTQITMLSTPEETKAARILAALDTLVKDTVDGDLVYIHYSGHGAQIPDKTKPTGLGDAIVPSDYANDRSNWIAGRTIGEYVRKIKLNRPHTLLVLSFDCCCSGTAARGEDAKRGQSFEEYNDWFVKRKKPVPPAKSPEAVSRGAAGKPGKGPIDDLNGAGYVVLSACADAESAYQFNNSGVTMGRMTYCLTKALSAAGPKTTYAEIFDQVRAMLESRFVDVRQTPQIDGQPDVPLFGGIAVERPKSILVSPIRAGVCKLEAGKLQGMTVGSTFAIYAKNAPFFDETNQIAEAKITSDGLDLATAAMQITKEIKTGLDSSDLTGAHAQELAHNYGKPPLALDVPSLQRAAPGAAAALLKQLVDPDAPLRMIKTELAPGEHADVKIDRVPATSFNYGDEQSLPKPGADGKVLALVATDTGIAYVAVDESGDVPGQLFVGLQKYARYRYAVGLGEDQKALNPTDRIRIRLRRCDPPAKDADGNLAFTKDRDIVTDGRLRIGDFFTIEVENSGPNPLHLTILDLESSAAVSVAWPQKMAESQDNIIPAAGAGKWTKLWIFSDTSRYAVYECGTADPHEIYRAIATKDYVDFKLLESRSGQRGPNSPFSDLIGPAVDDGARGPQIVTTVKPTGWTAATLVFSAVK